MKGSCYYSTKHLYAQIGVRGGYVHHSVFIFSTRSVLLILFYHLTAFGQPRYGDIGQSVLAWMCIPYKKRDFSVSGTCVPCRKIPYGLLLYFLSLPGNLKSFLHESQKILSLFTELFTSPANAPVNKFLAFSRKCSRRNIPDHDRKDPHH